ncbi:hypothetical protein GQ43DRAFT_35400 [Delitschia confertaspora ATCC 74209]|uniref:Uncharacterized protein n=1 Tax=Delitschia confertaspora ATCC 74209 TaxID=1513339 RepID=A0A9P4JQM9_9PLEO|nr:hypothetical protein GQ43DRAFT_35400 [Delitschia confertaspora ATCC 74209]
MLTSSIILPVLLGLTSALPTTLNARAGGPAITPIPSTCSITSPFPVDAAADQTFQLKEETRKSILYEAYYGDIDYDREAKSLECFQQCYGYGYHTECQGAYWAEKLIVPKGYYNTEGGVLSTGCLMFTRPLTAEDFVVAEPGRNIKAAAANIAC